MPKNKGKGGKNRRRGKNENDFMKRELDTKEEGQEYGQVMKMLGNGRVSAFCFDGKQRVCHIRGKLRKKVWINTGDIILIGLRDYQDDKADVILKYTPDEARQLKHIGQLPENAKINENDEQDEGEVEFILGAGADGEEEGEESEDDFPSSGSDSDSDDDDDDEDAEKKPKKPVPVKKAAPQKKKEESSEEESSEEESEEEDSDDLNEEELARGKGLLKPIGGTGRGNGRGGKNKYGKRR